MQSVYSDNMISQKELIRDISDYTGYKQSDIKEVLDGYETCIMHYVAQGEEVKLFTGLSLRGVQKDAMMVRNPVTDENVWVPARTTVKAACTQSLRRKFW